VTGIVVCFEEQRRNKQPLPALIFSSRTSTLLIPFVGMKILSEVVFYKTNNLPFPEEHWNVPPESNKASH
jgi:hypothetical protein